jgi:2,3-diketo-5-methylthio-1-phosphopentane phosphatase
MGVEKILILCDFDGTASTVDVGNELLDRFTGDGWKDIDRDYCDGKIGSRSAYTRIAPLFRGNRAQMLAYVFEKSTLDPFFADFYTYCRRMGMDLKIISDGLDFYIEAILKKNGLSEIEFFSNYIIFQDHERLSIEFPQASSDCGKCGNCKSRIVEQYRPLYDRIIYIGDSYSDVCPSKNADLVFAKKILYEKCSDNGTPCIYYNNFYDIQQCLEDQIAKIRFIHAVLPKPVC